MRDIGMIDFSFLDDLDLDFIEPEPYVRPNIPKVSPYNNKGNLLQKYLRAINPRMMYHGGSKIFNKFDMGRAGELHGMYKGYGGYLTDKYDWAKGYGDKVSKFYIPQDINILEKLTPDMENILNNEPMFNKWHTDNYGSRNADKLFYQYLDKKGYPVRGGLPNGSGATEYVITDPNKYLLPANTTFQRIKNRFFNNIAIKYGSKLLNRITTPLMILEGLGLNQPVGQGSSEPPIYPINGKLEGYITNQY